MTRTTLLATAVLLVGAAAAACGGGNKVGDEKLLEFDEKNGSRVGAVTTTTAPPTTARGATTAAPATTVARAATTAKAAATTTSTARPAASFTVRMVEPGQRYEPFAFSVKRGTVVRVVNADTVPRQMRSDVPGRFDTGRLAPGGAAEFVANVVGKNNFSDPEIPGALGEMDVQA